MTPEQAAHPEPWAWGVQKPDGSRAVYLDHARAEQCAADSHGVLVPLGEIERHDS